jgi:ABC-type phosphate transport system substrate-binding protein
MTVHIRDLTRCAMVLLALMWLDPASASDEIIIIVARDAPDYSINRVMLRDIYLKKIFLDDNGRPIVPVNLPPENPLRLSLAETLFNKSARQLQDYWNQRYFQGVAPPHVLSSQEAVVQFVAKTPGAIGYIAACRLDARVREVLAIPVAPSQRGALAKLCSYARNANQQD